MRFDWSLSWFIFYGAFLVLVQGQLTRMEMVSYLREPAPTRDSRTRFAPDDPLLITAYPSEGGIVIGQLTAVELAYLNVSRFETTFRSSDATEEDTFSFNLMRLGAHWYSDWKVYWHHREARCERLIPYDFHCPPTIHTAYPSTGGVWVFKHSADIRSWSSDDIPGRNPSLPQEPDDLRSALSLCLTMDERSLVLEKFGGTFCDNISNCADIPKSLHAGIQTGLKFAVLLQKMADRHYVDEWLDGHIC